MRKLIYAAALAFMAYPAGGADIANDMMMVVMTQEAHGQDGIYWQSIPHRNCMNLLSELASALQKDSTMELGLQAARKWNAQMTGPKVAVAGTVVSLSCVHADGSVDTVSINL